MRLEFKEKVVTVQIEAPWYDQQINITFGTNFASCRHIQSKMKR
jgi:hypothetical protein